MLQKGSRLVFVPELADLVHAGRAHDDPRARRPQDQALLHLLVHVHLLGRDGAVAEGRFLSDLDLGPPARIGRSGRPGRAGSRLDHVDVVLAAGFIQLVLDVQAAELGQDVVLLDALAVADVEALQDGRGCGTNTFSTASGCSCTRATRRHLAHRQGHQARTPAAGPPPRQPLTITRSSFISGNLPR